MSYNAQKCHRSPLHLHPISCRMVIVRNAKILLWMTLNDHRHAAIARNTKSVLRMNLNDNYYNDFIQEDAL